MKTLSRTMVFAVLVSLCLPLSVALADVFAHNVRITQPDSDLPFDARFSDGTGAAIRFILSDRADSVVVTVWNGPTLIRTIKAVSYLRGDTSVIWDGMTDAATPAPTGNYTVKVATYDQGYGTYTEIYHEGTGGLSTRGVTSVRNAALKSFGYSYGIDNNGYLGAVGITRMANDGTPWGDVKGNPKVTNTGVTLGSGEARYSPEADQNGYVYLIGHTQRQVIRFDADSLVASIVDSGSYGSWYVNGIGLLSGANGTLVALTARNASGVASFGTDSRILGFHLNPGQAQNLTGRDTIVTSQGEATFWDVTFGRDSVLYATYNYLAPHAPGRGLAKFDLKGKTWPLTMNDTSWTVPLDSGNASTTTYHWGAAGDGSQDVVYFIEARIASGNPPSGQAIYAVADPGNAVSPTRVVAYPDPQNNASITRSDIAVDAVGNIVYFENSNEEISIISPPTGPNSYTYTSSAVIKVITSEPIADVRIDANSDRQPDRNGQVVTVIGVVSSGNPTAAANRWQYFIEDGTGGVSVTKGSETGGGTVYALGDRIAVTGTVGQFRGLTQINVANIGTDVTLLDTGNPVNAATVTLEQLVANPESFEGQLVKVNGVTKAPGSVAWPAASSNAGMTIWDGVTSLLLFIDSDTDIDGSTEPVYPLNVMGTFTQFSSGTTVYDDGYEIAPNFRTDFTEGVAVAPRPDFALSSPTNGSSITLNDTIQVKFTWARAFDLNGDNLIYQWAPVGFSAITTANAGADTFIVRTGAQLKTYLGASDTVVLKWSAKTKDAGPIVNNKDTVSVTLIRGTLTGVGTDDLIPMEYALMQNYPNPFNPSTNIRFALPTASTVMLKVYNILGQEVATLFEGLKDAGYVDMTWNGHDNFGRSVASGVYLYRFEARAIDGTRTYTSNRKMVMMK